MITHIEKMSDIIKRQDFSALVTCIIILKLRRLITTYQNPSLFLWY